MYMFIDIWTDTYYGVKSNNSVQKETRICWVHAILGWENVSLLSKRLVDRNIWVRGDDKPSIQRVLFKTTSRGLELVHKDTNQE